MPVSLFGLLSSFRGLQIDSGHSLLVQGPPTPDQRQSQEQVRALRCPQTHLQLPGLQASIFLGLPCSLSLLQSL